MDPPNTSPDYMGSGNTVLAWPRGLTMGTGALLVLGCTPCVASSISPSANLKALRDRSTGRSGLRDAVHNDATASSTRLLVIQAFVHALMLVGFKVHSVNLWWWSCTPETFISRQGASLHCGSCVRFKFFRSPEAASGLWSHLNYLFGIRGT